MTIKGFLCLLLSMVVPSSVLGFYSPSDGVVELTSSNFDRLVVQDDAIWIVEFYVTWCGASENFAPEYTKLAKALKGVVKVGAVDCDEHKSLSNQYGVHRAPNFKIFGANKRSPIDYKGQRTAMSIAELALAEVKKKVQATISESTII